MSISAGKLTLGRIQSRCIIGLTAVALATQCASGASILFVGGTEAPETDTKTQLESFGHTVTDPAAFADGAPSSADLTGIDLVLVGRSANSGNYDDGSEPEDWNTLDIPLLLMSSYLIRTSRWGWVDTTTVTDAAPAPTDFNAYPNPNHPYVAGLGTSVFPTTFNNGSPMQVDWGGTTNQVPAGANVVSTLTIAGNSDVLGIVEYPAGTTLFTNASGTASTLVAPRAFFQMNEFTENDEEFVLSENGLEILNQMINTLVPNPTLAGDVNGDGSVDADDYVVIRDHFQQSVTMRSDGDLNNDGIVDFDDFRQWKVNRTDLGPPSGQAPEPSGVVLLLVGASAAVRGARGRRTA